MLGDSQRLGSSWSSCILSNDENFNRLFRGSEVVSIPMA